MFGRIAHGADFDVCRARRNADHHLDRGRKEVARSLDLLDHTAQHQFGGREIGDHAVFERTDRLDVGVGLLMHGARPFADGDQLARVGVDGDDRRLVHHHAAVVDNQGIGRTEVDGQLLCQRKKSHIVFYLLFSILSGFRAGCPQVRPAGISFAKTVQVGSRTERSSFCRSAAYLSRNLSLAKIGKRTEYSCNNF